MMEFGQPALTVKQETSLQSTDLSVPPASFNHITNTKSLGHVEHARQIHHL